MEGKTMKKLGSILISIVLIGTILISLTGNVAAMPPQTPKQPKGPTTCNINVEYTYTITGIGDFDDDLIKYYVDWGDGTNSGWSSAVSSFEDITVTHTWTEYGRYEIKVKAKDNNGSIETSWSEILNANVDPLILVGVSGGMGISIAVQNQQNISKRINWRVELIGGTIPGFHMNKIFDTATDENDTLEPIHIGSYATESIMVSPSLALGNFKINVEVETGGYEHEITETYDAFILFFYVILR